MREIGTPISEANHLFALTTNQHNQPCSSSNPLSSSSLPLPLWLLLPPVVTDGVEEEEEVAEEVAEVAEGSANLSCSPAMSTLSAAVTFALPG